MKKSTFKKHQSGFTLIEIIVVVVIISVLAAVIAPNMFGQVYKGRLVSAKANIGSISKGLALYRLENFKYPSTGEGLSALVPKHIEKLPKDPWGNDYQYLSPGQKSKDFDLWSNGSDGTSGGTDEATDIGNWNLDEL